MNIEGFGDLRASFAKFDRDILRARVKAGIAQARKEGRPHGRSPTVGKYVPQVRAMAKGFNKSEIAHRLCISRDFRAPILSPSRTAAARVSV
jgi:DNA invertase Pin-like site-specific DNA recombinase